MQLELLSLLLPTPHAPQYYFLLSVLPSDFSLISQQISHVVPNFRACATRSVAGHCSLCLVWAFSQLQCSPQDWPPSYRSTRGLWKSVVFDHRQEDCAIFRRIPFRSGTFTRFNWRGWEIVDRYRAHQQLGDAILFMTPGKHYLQLCNADAVSDIFQRRADFLRPPESAGKVLAHTQLMDTHEGRLEILNIFGPNFGTVSSPPSLSNRSFDRRTNPNGKDIEALQLHLSMDMSTNAFGMESILQATGIIDYWSSKSSIDSVAADTRTVSLHVISGAVFGKSYPFRGADEDNSPTKEDSSSYGGALRIIVDRCIPLVVLGRKNLSPRGYRRVFESSIKRPSFSKSI